MVNKNKSLNRNMLWMIISVIITISLYVLFLVLHPVYFHSDNWEVSVVTAGYYEGFFCQYLHPLICIIIRGISVLLPTADVFTLLIHLAIGIGVTLTLFLAIKIIFGIKVGERTIKDWLLLIIVILAELYITQGLRVWNANYNIQTGAILFYGMILAFSTNYVSHRKLFFVECGLIIFGFMLRIAVAYLFIPYFSLEIIVNIIENKWRRDLRSGTDERARHSIFACSMRWILPTIIILLLIISRLIFLSIEPYKSAEDYNRYRTVSVDYPMKKFSEIESPDFTNAEYEMATDWMFMDTEYLNVEKLKSIADQGYSNKYRVTDYKHILLEMWKTVSRIDIYMFLMLMITGVILTRNIICCKTWLRKIESVLAILGSFIILYYFTYRGRAPIRVWQPVLFASNGVLIGAAAADTRRNNMFMDVLCCEQKNIKYIDIFNSISLIAMLVILWYGAGQIIAHAQFQEPQNILTARMNVDDSVYEETFRDEAIYIWPNWHATIPDYFIKKGKLPTQRVMDHNIPAGDWTYGQVYYNGFLKRIGVPNPAEALVNSNDVFLMDGNCDKALNYLREQFGEDLELMPRKKIHGVMAYQVVHGGEENQ